MQGKLYLEVPYAEKALAKSLDVQWDSMLKKWFYQGSVSDYVKFARTGNWPLSRMSISIS